MSTAADCPHRSPMKTRTRFKRRQSEDEYLSVAGSSFDAAAAGSAPIDAGNKVRRMKNVEGVKDRVSTTTPEGKPVWDNPALQAAHTPLKRVVEFTAHQLANGHDTGQQRTKVSGKRSRKASTDTVNGWASLPDIILARIFSHFVNPKDRWHVRLVCGRWREVAQRHLCAFDFNFGPMQVENPPLLWGLPRSGREQMTTMGICNTCPLVIVRGIWGPDVGMSILEVQRRERLIVCVFNARTVINVHASCAGPITAPELCGVLQATALYSSHAQVIESDPQMDFTQFVKAVVWGLRKWRHPGDPGEMTKEIENIDTQDQKAYENSLRNVLGRTNSLATPNPDVVQSLVKTYRDAQKDAMTTTESHIKDFDNGAEQLMQVLRGQMNLLYQGGSLAIEVGDEARGKLIEVPESADSVLTLLRQNILHNWGWFRDSHFLGSSDVLVCTNPVASASKIVPQKTWGELQKIGEDILINVKQTVKAARKQHLTVLLRTNTVEMIGRWRYLSPDPTAAYWPKCLLVLHDLMRYNQLGDYQFWRANGCTAAHTEYRMMATEFTNIVTARPGQGRREVIGRRERFAHRGWDYLQEWFDSVTYKITAIAEGGNTPHALSYWCGLCYTLMTEFIQNISDSYKRGFMLEVVKTWGIVIDACRPQLQKDSFLALWLYFAYCEIVDEPTPTMQEITTELQLLCMPYRLPDWWTGPVPE